MTFITTWAKQGKKYRPLISELIKRDLKVKYRRSFLGYLWSLLNPLLMMTIMTLVFSTVFRFDIQNFPLYLICGQTLYSFFNESTNIAMYSITSNAPLIKKVYIPKFIFPISRVLSCFVTTSFSFLAIIIVMIFTKTPITIYFPLIIFPLLFLLLFASGIGMILSALAVYFQDITHLYSVLTLAWMYLTPIFYPVEAVPEFVKNIIYCNPLYHYIEMFRCFVLNGCMPDAQLWLWSVLSSSISLVLGVLIFNKLQKNFILHI
ncbi:MAG: ABC transporter permease [Oscillospiraceae bacterium]|nr:ABC transporter permease [Oscillospiraceae bacterium]